MKLCIAFAIFVAIVAARYAQDYPPAECPNVRAGWNKKCGHAACAIWGDPHCFKIETLGADKVDNAGDPTVVKRFIEGSTKPGVFDNADKNRGKPFTEKSECMGARLRALFEAAGLANIQVRTRFSRGTITVSDAFAYQIDGVQLPGTNEDIVITIDGVDVRINCGKKRATETELLKIPGLKITKGTIYQEFSNKVCFVHKPGSSTAIVYYNKCTTPLGKGYCNSGQSANNNNLYRIFSWDGNNKEYNRVDVPKDRDLFQCRRFTKIPSVRPPVDPPKPTKYPQPTGPKDPPKDPCLKKLGKGVRCTIEAIEQANKMCHEHFAVFDPSTTTGCGETASFEQGCVKDICQGITRRQMCGQEDANWDCGWLRLAVAAYLDEKPARGFAADKDCRKFQFRGKGWPLMACMTPAPETSSGSTGNGSGSTGNGSGSTGNGSGSTGQGSSGSTGKGSSGSTGKGSSGGGSGFAPPGSGEWFRR